MDANKRESFTQMSQRWREGLGIAERIQKDAGLDCEKCE
jgi:hypothetical protein